MVPPVSNHGASHIPSLDGLRAVSISIVFIAHAGLDRVIPGGLGVTIFFVLSGYLITTLMRTESANHGAVSISAFYTRRAFRILPLFYSVLTLAVVATLFLGLAGGSVNVAATAAQYGHITNYWAIFRGGFIPGTGVYWSLAVEEHFYLLFPVAFAFLQRRGVSLRNQARLFLGISAGVLLWRLALVHVWHVSVDRTYLATDTRIDSILIGCAIAVALNPRLDTMPSVRTLRLSAGVSAAVLLGSLLLRTDAFRETFRYSIQSVAIAGLLIYVVACPTDLPGRLLNTRPMAWLGRLSFAFYLVHHVILLEYRDHWSAVPAALLGLATALLVAVALQRLVEQPAHRMRVRLLSRLAARQEPATTA